MNHIHLKWSNQSWHSPSAVNQSCLHLISVCKWKYHSRNYRRSLLLFLWFGLIEWFVLFRHQFELGLPGTVVRGVWILAGGFGVWRGQFFARIVGLWCGRSCWSHQLPDLNLFLQKCDHHLIHQPLQLLHHQQVLICSTTTSCRTLYAVFISSPLATIRWL